MGDSIGSSQADVSDPLICGIPVTTFFEETPFTAPIRTDFDSRLWGAQIEEGTDPSTPMLTTYAIRMFYSYHESSIVDSTLFWAYREEFHGWKISWFRRLDARLRSTFKQILRSHGVYTGPNRAHIGQQLADLLDADEVPEWPEDEITEQEFISASRLSEQGQEREAQRQIRRDQATRRLAELRATSNTRAQASSPYSPDPPTRIQQGSRTARAPPVTAPQVHTQPSIEILPRHAQEQQTTVPDDHRSDQTVHV
jgi:hypothetical protein